MRTVLLAIVIAILITYLSGRFLPVPFLWIGVACGALLGGLAMVARNVTARAIFVNLAVACATVGMIEGYLATQKKSTRHFEGAYVERYFDKSPSPILGYRPYKNTVVDSRRYFHDELIYDVTYSIDANGLRSSTPVPQTGSDRCILFFGGSFTFGEGVEDDETAAYRVGQRLDGRYRIFNFGFHGYGPHQMLSALESDLVGSITDCDVRYVFYQGLVEHVQRSAGLGLWDLTGPRYVLSERGVERRGSLFEAYHLPLPIIELLKKSLIFNKVIGWLYGAVGDEEIELYLAIIDRSRNVVADLFPAARFHVLQWPPLIPPEQRVFRSLVAGMAEKDLDHTWVTEIIPDLTDEQGKKKYRIPHDGHPNSRVHDRISDHIVTEIIGE